MSASLIEIVQLATGEIVVKRIDPDDDSKTTSLVTIHFSKDAREFMGDATLEVARAMVHAGLDCVADLIDEAVDEDASFPDDDLSPRVLH